MFTNSPHNINGQKMYFFESHQFSEKNYTLHLKIAHSVRILQSNKQNMWKWPILHLGLKGLTVGGSKAAKMRKPTYICFKESFRLLYQAWEFGQVWTALVLSND